MTNNLESIENIIIKIKGTQLQVLTQIEKPVEDESEEFIF